MTATLRIDKWLWFARFYKTRSLAASVLAEGGVRLNGAVVVKAAQTIKPGDVLVFPTGPKWRQVRVVALSERRGPAPEAQALYEELAAPPNPDEWREGRG